MVVRPRFQDPSGTRACLAGSWGRWDGEGRVSKTVYLPGRVRRGVEGDAEAERRVRGARWSESAMSLMRVGGRRLTGSESET